MKFEQANTYTNQWLWQGISWKGKEKKHELYHDLTFHCTHNQLGVCHSIKPMFRVLGIHNSWTQTQKQQGGIVKTKFSDRLFFCPMSNMPEILIVK